MNSVDCSERRIQSLSRRYLSLKKGPPRESSGGRATQSSSLTPLALHITSFSSARETEKKATDKKTEEEKKIKTQNPIQSKEKETARGKKMRRGELGGHALINERLISTKLITGSWM